MNARRDSLLQGDASPPSSGLPNALLDAGEKGRPRPLPVVSGYRQSERGTRLAWLSGLLLLCFVSLCGLFCAWWGLRSMADPSARDGLAGAARAAAYAAPLFLLFLPGIFGKFLVPLLKARGQDIVLRLDAKGFLDERNGYGFIPWSAVRGLRNGREIIEVKVDWRALPEEQRPGGPFGRFRKLRILALPLEVSSRDLFREMAVRRRAAS